ncbi:hypothetical protein ATANTOWER_029563 [Ataeniobius toweri]|uniref:Uncharacterized protein n=1 Tax=Ataeniobius toweri TaxID=208326 RepID=A0ABU7ADI3_9TELE|nr:hypothetical protein [Ataeniobius toweri]
MPNPIRCLKDLLLCCSRGAATDVHLTSGILPLQSKDTGQSKNIGQGLQYLWSQEHVSEAQLYSSQESHSRKGVKAEAKPLIKLTTAFYYQDTEELDSTK